MRPAPLIVILSIIVSLAAHAGPMDAAPESASAADPAATQPTATAPATRPAKLIDFKTIGIEGGVLHLQPALLPKRQQIAGRLEASIRKVRKLNERAKRILKLEEKALKAVNNLLGIEPDEPLRKAQKRFYRIFTDSLVVNIPARAPIQFWVARERAIKAHMRAGGELPTVTYNPETNRANLSIHAGRGTNVDIKLTRLTLPIDLESDDPYQYLDVLSTAADFYDQVRLAGVVHEVVESSILETVGFATPHRRWFSDGLADVVTLRILRRFGREKEAKAYWQGRYRPKRFEIWRDRANLRYWLNKGVGIEPPINREEELELARYGFAAYEMKRLIDKHGEKAIARVMDELARKDKVGAEVIFAAIRAATGVDMTERLAKYNEYESREKAIEAYQSRFLHARRAEAPKKALIALLRLMELRIATTDKLPYFYMQTATLLLQMDQPETSRAVWKQLVTVASDPATKHQMRGAWMAFALKHGRPSLAYKAAPPFLKRAPNATIALIIRAHRLAEKGKTGQARQLARRLLPRQAVQRHVSVARQLRRIAEPPASQPAAE